MKINGPGPNSNWNAHLYNFAKHLPLGACFAPKIGIGLSGLLGLAGQTCPVDDFLLVFWLVFKCVGPTPLRTHI